MDNGCKVMFKIIIKYKILELCIDKFFSTLSKNFPLGNIETVQVSTLGDHNITQYIGRDIIDLKLDPDVSQYMTSYEYVDLKSNIESIINDFPMEIRKGDISHTVNLYRYGQQCGIIQFGTNLMTLSCSQVNINTFLYLVIM